MKIGAAQFASEPGNVDANIEIHLDWIARGQSEKVDLLVMPEMSLAGHYGAVDLLSAAITCSDPRLMRLAEAAGDMTVVVGFIEEGSAAQFYNTAAMLKDGKIIHMHRKVNLANYGMLDEGKHFAPGRFVEIYSLDEVWRAGLLICSDIWNPALTHLAFLRGATLMITPVSSAVEAVPPKFDNPSGWALAIRFYAMIYGAPCIMVNRTGVEKDLTFWGGSRIIDPFGNEVAVAGSGEELIMAELDFDQVRKARYQLPTVRDSNIALVHLETSRLIENLGVPDIIDEQR
ncbi:MAG: nitrilase-related carbon-nitrogen hydrolase [Gammaproteobacteria bacterium]